jgi:hypothetical protein
MQEAAQASQPLFGLDSNQGVADISQTIISNKSSTVLRKFNLSNALS